MGIKNCKHKGFQELFAGGKTPRIGKQYHRNILLVMELLDNITDLSDCAGVKNFHRLKGDRKDTYAMHVGGNCVITFKWDGKAVYGLNFEDYH